MKFSLIFSIFFSMVAQADGLPPGRNTIRQVEISDTAAAIIAAYIGGAEKDFPAEIGKIESTVSGVTDTFTKGVVGTSSNAGSDITIACASWYHFGHQNKCVAVQKYK